MPPGDAAPERADGRLGGALLLRAGDRAEPGEGRIPRYAWKDPYSQLRAKLEELGAAIGGEYRVLVDANRHVDREGAAPLGVGFYGKNTLLITRRFGSWVVIGTLVTDVAIEMIAAARHRCGSSPPLHRRLPDGGPRRAGHARRDAVSLVLDAGAGPDPGGAALAARGSRLRL